MFVWPTMAQAAPNVISGEATEAPQYLFSGIALSNYSLFLGWILFGASTIFRARVLSSLARGPADRRDPGHRLSFPDARIIPRVHRADFVRHCGCGPWFLCLEGGTLKCLVISTTRLDRIWGIRFDPGAGQRVLGVSAALANTIWAWSWRRLRCQLCCRGGERRGVAVEAARTRRGD